MDAMNRKILHTFCAILLLFPLKLAAQKPENRFRNVEELIETLAGEMEEGEENSSWLEELKQLSENRININSAGTEELLRIPFLNELSIREILQYRSKYGPFFTVYEVASVPGIGRDLAEKISFFITPGPAEEKAGRDTLYKPRGYHDLFLRSWTSFPSPAGYRPSEEKPAAYAGNPLKIYVRYGYEKSDRIKAGITADKDPGESFFRNANPTGFDFYSSYVAFRISDAVPQVIAGDFSAKTGQGLVLWQGFSMGRTADATQLSKNMSRLAPYTSSDENRHFRGVAVTFQLGKGKLNMLLSSKKRDANLETGSDSLLSFTSLQSSGYHRTASEIADKESVRHSVAALFYTRVGDNIKTGFTALYEHFQYPWIPGSQLYQKFLFTGSNNFNIGADYRWIVRNTQFYGEGAICRSGGFALIQGMEARLHDQVNLTLQYRHFSRNYHSTWASVPALNDKANNESGYYAGVRVYPASGLTLSACADWCRSPWILYTTASPSEATEYMLRADYRLPRHLSGYIRYRNRVREGKIHEEPMYLNTSEQRENLRLQTTYELNEQFSLSWRAEISGFRTDNKERGFLALQDASWKPSRYPLSANLRLSWFSTSSYNTRIYSFENDLLYAFSSLSFSGKGVRSYLNLKGSLNHNTDIWLKIANTCYFDREVISSGQNEIKGKSKTELKIQFRVKF